MRPVLARSMPDPFMSNTISLSKVGNGYIVQLPMPEPSYAPSVSSMTAEDYMGVAQKMAETMRGTMHKDPELERIRQENEVKSEQGSGNLFPRIGTDKNEFVFSTIDEALAFIKLCCE